MCSSDLHTALRLSQGLSGADVQNKFGSHAKELVDKIAQPLIAHKVIVQAENAYKLTDNGILVSNQVFEKFTFLKNDLL